MTLTHTSLRAALAAVMCLTLAGCETTKEGEGAATGAEEQEGAASGEMDLSMLLSMSYTEAAALSPQKLEMAPFYKIAADEIEVTKTDKDGKPRKVRAKGKVFIQMDYREPATALCQEALIGEDEIILRGKPVLQRGGSVVEGLNDFTVFYMLGTQLRVIGLHKLTNQGEIVALENSSAMPYYRDSWEQGPNPLLPPLTPGAVPDSIRAELQKAAEAEAMLQQNRAAAGPAKLKEETAPAPPPPEEEKKDAKPAEKKDPESTSADGSKKSDDPPKKKTE